MQYTSKDKACRAAEGLLIQAGATEAEIGSVMAALANPAVKLVDSVALLDGPFAVTKLKSFAASAGATDSSGAGAAAGRTPGALAGAVNTLATAITNASIKLSSVRSAPKALGMSSVGSSKAEAVLGKLGFKLIDGNVSEPIQPPKQGFRDTAAFAMHAYRDEVGATPAFIPYLQGELEKNGVRFGPNGLELIDVHASSGMLELRLDDLTFRGHLDVVAVPFSVRSIQQVVRLAVGLKHMEQDKDLYKKANPQLRSAVATSTPAKRRLVGMDVNVNQAADTESRDTVEDAEEERGLALAAGSSSAVKPLDRAARTDPFKWTASIMGQSVIELLAVYSMSEYPAHLIITEGYIYHVLRLRNKELIVWADLDPATAIYHVANSLKKEECYLRTIPPPPESAPLDPGLAALAYMRQFNPLATLYEQVEQLMGLDDGRSKLEQAKDVVRLIRDQHGPAGVAALLGLPVTLPDTTLPCDQGSNPSNIDLLPPRDSWKQMFG